MATPPLGSTTSLVRSMSARCAARISASAHSATSSTRARTCAKVSGESDVRKPSAMVTLGSVFGMSCKTKSNKKRKRRATQKVKTSNGATENATRSAYLARLVAEVRVARIVRLAANHQAAREKALEASGRATAQKEKKRNFFF